MKKGPSRPAYFVISIPRRVIGLVVLLYVRFPLSLQNVKDLPFERGGSEPRDDRLLVNRFGPMFAGNIRRQRVSAMRGFRQWHWHFDEVFVKINGDTHHLWRAVNHEGGHCQTNQDLVRVAS